MAEGGSGHANTINSYPTRSASLHQPDGMVTQVREACTTELAQLIKEKLQTSKSHGHYHNRRPYYRHHYRY
jgi:hypothetical protein